MKKLLLLFLCVPFFFNSCKKEEENITPNNTNLTWKKTFSGYAYSVQQTSDGGYIIAGEATHPNTGGNSYVIKTDLNGNIIWTKDSGHSGEIFYVDQTADGGYILTGSRINSDDAHQNQLILIKIDANGNEEWYNIFSSDDNRGWCVQQTFDGGYIIFSTKGLIKTDANGNELWNNIESLVYYKVYDGQQTSDGGYICTGELDTDPSHNGGGTQEDVFLSKFNSNGNQQWVKTWDFGSQKDESGFYVEQTADGGYILSVGAGTHKLIKTDSNGNEIWTYDTYVSEGSDGGCWVNQTLDGGYIIANMNITGGIDLTKLDSQGNSIWTTTTYSLEFSNVHRIYQTTDLGFIILGNTGDFNDWDQGETDIILIKTDSQGNY